MERVIKTESLDQSLRPQGPKLKPQIFVSAPAYQIVGVLYLHTTACVCECPVNSTDCSVGNACPSTVHTYTSHLGPEELPSRFDGMEPAGISEGRMPQRDPRDQYGQATFEGNNVNPPSKELNLFITKACCARDKGQSP